MRINFFQSAERNGLHMTMFTTWIKCYKKWIDYFTKRILMETYSDLTTASKVESHLCFSVSVGKLGRKSVLSLFLKMSIYSLGRFDSLHMVHPYPEAVLEALADNVEGDWVDAGVYRRHVDANVVQHQKETKRVTETN